MNFLSINTCSNICSVALFEDKKISLKEKENIKDHSEYIAIYAKELIEKSAKKIEFIAVAIGPGSYTGLKVGLSFAKGLSLALSIPLFPVETFLAMNEKINFKGNYYIALFSHRDYLYVQEYNNRIPIKESKCMRYNELDEHKIFGYGLECIENLSFVVVKPSSLDIGEFTIKNYDKIKKDSSKECSPIYLSV